MRYSAPAATLAMVLAAALVTPLAAPAAELGSEAPWSRLTTLNFELYTTAGEKAGHDAILYFEQVRGFFLKAAPVRFPAGFPVRIVIFKNQQQFAEYSVHAVEIAYYAAGPKRDYIVMSDASPESYAIAVHEYMHLIIRHSGLRIPVWLNEGLADVYSSMRPVKDGVAVGDLIPGRMQPLLTGRWLTFESLTSTDTHSAVYNEADRVGVFYAESWALAHMLFLSPEYRDNFGKFLSALHRGQSTAEVCQTVYGKTGDRVIQDLHKYITGDKFVGRIFETKLGKSETQPLYATVPPFNARLMLADLLVATDKGERARAEYHQLEQQMPGDPEVNQSLGFFALSAHDTPLAREYFEKAFAAGETDPQMCLELALMERAANEPDDRIVPPLERAIRAKPDYTEAQVQLGLMQVKQRRFEAAVNTFMSVENVTPEQAPALFASLAYACIETGDTANARKNADTALKWAKTPQEKDGLAKLIGFIQARSTGPFAVHPGEQLIEAAGTLLQVECEAGQVRLRLLASAKSLVLTVPNPDAVEFTHAGSGSLQFTCGPQKPLPIRVTYATLNSGDQTTAGVIRRIEY